ncbi:MAG: hypothetical protein V1726_03045 [Methanobacteriota archaeon]
MEIKNPIQIRNFSGWTILSLLMLIAGIIFYILWGTYYGVWADIGIYSITAVFVVAGLFGTLLSLSIEKKQE